MSTADKSLLDTIKSLRDANIDRSTGPGRNEEIINGQLTRLHNSESDDDRIECW